MRIVLINLPPRNPAARHWAEPLLGLAYVAASLRAAGHELVVLDGKLADLSEDHVVERALGARAGLVGVTAMTVEFPQAARVARRLRARGGPPVVLGGAHANSLGERVLDECEALDFACIGEGEALAPELAAALECGGDLSEIDGLAWRRGGAAVRNRARAYPRDYDGLAFPAWDLFPVGRRIPLLTHRGCPFRCNFCCHNSGTQPRYRSPDNVLAEIDELVERHRPEVLRFEDETFGLNVARTRRILEGILARGIERRVRFSAQTRADRVDREFVRLLVRCRFEMLELGVESGSPEVLGRMGKGVSLERVEHAVRLAREEGLRVWCKLIVGHPNETRRDLLATLRFVARANPDRISVAVMTPFPGTPIWDMARRGQNGYRLLSQDWEDFDKYGGAALELDDIGRGELELWQMLTYAALYVPNGRLADLAGLVWRHAPLAREMLASAGGKLLRRRRPAAMAG